MKERSAKNIADLEQNILLDKDYKYEKKEDIFDKIVNMIAVKQDKYQVIRMICLLSQTRGGIDSSELN